MDSSGNPGTGELGGSPIVPVVTTKVVDVVVVGTVCVDVTVVETVDVATVVVAVTDWVVVEVVVTGTVIVVVAVVAPGMAPKSRMRLFASDGPPVLRIDHPNRVQIAADRQGNGEDARPGQSVPEEYERRSGTVLDSYSPSFGWGKHVNAL